MDLKEKANIEEEKEEEKTLLTNQGSKDTPN